MLLYSYEPKQKQTVYISTAEETRLSTSLPPTVNGSDLKEILYDNRSELKRSISEIAMHMKDETRNDFFKQIDELLDIEEFTEGDSLISKQSFRTFLNFFSTTCRAPPC